MQADQIQRVLIVGAGTMGQQIGLQCAIHGFDVVMLDNSADSLSRAQAAMPAIAAYAASDPMLAGLPVLEAPSRINYTTDPGEASSEVDVVSESIPEDPVLKGRVFAELNALCSPRTIFTTNTSSLLPSYIAAATGRPDRFAAMHFHQPVWSANLVDIMPHPGTSEDTVDLLLGFAARIGQVPIRLHKENHGYVFNAMYNTLNREAITLVANGVASVEDVDLAWRTVMKTPLGPFAMMDHIGIDTVWHITDYWARTLGDDQLIRNAAFLKTYVDQGHLGVKTGKGFFDYSSE